MGQPRRTADLSLPEWGTAAQSPEAWGGITTEETGGGVTLSPKNTESTSGKQAPAAPKAQQTLTARSKRVSSGLASSRWAPGGSFHGHPPKDQPKSSKAPRGGLAKSLWAAGDVTGDSHVSEDEIMGEAE